MSKLFRRTKILCTLGPACSSEKTIRQLVREGMDVARLNFSHGSIDLFRRLVKFVRVTSRRLRRPVALLQDLPGAKIRLGRLPAENLRLQEGEIWRLYGSSRDLHEMEAYVDYPRLGEDVSPGRFIYLSDGRIRLRVQRSLGESIVCKVLVGGRIRAGMGVNIPDAKLRLPILTEGDREHIKRGRMLGFDMLAVSFARRGKDIYRVREFLEESGWKNPFLVAKIEKREAVENLHGILKASDAVMVARGDLGVELPLEDIALLQKEIITRANREGKPVITATQMLESMVESPSPTRAEVTDVSNAVLDGTDAVMLSEETAIGKYPVEATRALSRIIMATEKSSLNIRGRPDYWRLEGNVEDAIGRSACEIATQVGASVIMAPTRSGTTARRISKNRPLQPIIGLSPSRQVFRRLALVWGVYPMLAEGSWRFEKILREAHHYALKSGFTSRGDRIVVTAGSPWSPHGTTDILTVQELPV